MPIWADDPGFRTEPPSGYQEQGFDPVLPLPIAFLNWKLWELDTRVGGTQDTFLVEHFANGEHRPSILKPEYLQIPMIVMVVDAITVANPSVVTVRAMKIGDAGALAPYEDTVAFRVQVFDSQGRSYSGQDGFLAPTSGGGAALGDANAGIKELSIGSWLSGGDDRQFGVLLDTDGDGDSEIMFHSDAKDGVILTAEQTGQASRAVFEIGATDGNSATHTVFLHLTPVVTFNDKTHAYYASGGTSVFVVTFNL